MFSNRLFMVVVAVTCTLWLGVDALASRLIMDQVIERTHNYKEYYREELKGENKILKTDSVEMAYNKIVNIMKELKDWEYIEIWIYAYPEDKWYELLEKINNSNKFVTTPISYTGELEHYIRIEKK